MSSKNLFISVEDNQQICAIHCPPKRDAVASYQGPDFEEAEEEAVGQKKSRFRPLRRLERKPLIIMLHSFPGGHKASQNDLFGDLEHKLSQGGLDTLRFDFRGCGESEGKSEHFTLERAKDDLQAILKWARKSGFNRFIYIGEGLGATVALQNANAQVRALVLLWPALSPKDTFVGQFSPDSQYENHKVGRALLEEIRKFDPVGVLRDLKVPLLIQHGQADQKFPIGQLDLLRRHAYNTPRIEMTTYDNGEPGLEKLNERETMYYHIQQFLTRYA